MKKILLRVLIVGVAFAVVGFVLARAFKGFDLGAVVDTLGDLSGTDVAKITVAFIALLVAEAYLSASFVPGMSMGRGAIVWLGSNAVASVVPGPSDVPLRYRMFRSWGLHTADAATATAGATVVNLAAKLVLPAVAAVGLAVGQVEVGSVRGLVITGCSIFAAVGALIGFVFGSESRTAAAGRLVSRVVRRPMADQVVRYRNQALQLVSRTWYKTLLGITLVSVIYAVLFVWCMRAVGIDSDSGSWLALFCVWALVRGITILPTMPGDAGVSELAFVTLLTKATHGVDVNTVTAGVLLYRAMTWIAPIPFGAVAIGLWRWTLRRHPEREAGRDEPDEEPTAPAVAAD